MVRGAKAEKLAALERLEVVARKAESECTRAHRKPEVSHMFFHEGGYCGQGVDRCFAGCFWDGLPTHGLASRQDAAVTIEGLPLMDLAQILLDS